jgi:hypothetical protein
MNETNCLLQAVCFYFEGALAGGGEAEADFAGVGVFDCFAFYKAVLLETVEGFVDGGVVDVDKIVGVAVGLLLDGVAVEGPASGNSQVGEKPLENSGKSIIECVRWGIWGGM